VLQRNFSLDWKDRVCQTVKKAFVCLSVCNTFLKPQWNLLSVHWEWRFLLRQIKQNLSFSRDWSLSRLFFSCSFEDRVLLRIGLHCLSVRGEYGFETSIHLLADLWFNFDGWKVLGRLDLGLAVCLHNCYRTKMHSGHVVFSQLRISNLSQNIPFIGSPFP
jgi:hypothetical protein